VSGRLETPRISHRLCNRGTYLQVHAMLYGCVVALDILALDILALDILALDGRISTGHTLHLGT